jgi:hypothetical protein
MPLPLPNLDDRDYTELVEMARSLIPSEAPDWTDHNPSDTGIVLLELFAWLTELLLYRVNQIPDRSQESFLRLLRGNAKLQVDPAQLQAVTQQTILDLRQRYRAVTVADYEYLVMRDWAGKVARVKAFANRDLIERPFSNDARHAGYISLVILPQVAASASPYTLPADDLKAELWEYLDQRRLIATKHRIVGPDYVKVSVTADLYLEAGTRPDQVEQAALDQLEQFFHPLTGGEDVRGWPFGRSVYLSEVYQQLDQVPGVDYVQAVRLNSDTQSIDLADHQLVEFQRADSQLTIPEDE